MAEKTYIDGSTVFRSLNTPYIVFGIDDPTFTILEENEAHASVAMVTRKETVGKPLFDVFPDTSEEFVQTGVSPLVESIRKVIRTGKSDSMPDLSYDLRDKNGVFITKYWSVSHHPIFDDDGKVIAVFQHTKDTTEEVMMGEKLRIAEGRLEKVLGSSQIGTWTLDLQNQLVAADANLARMFGLEKKYLEKGVPLDIFIAAIHPDDRDRVTTEISKSIQSQKSYEIEYRTVPSKGTVRWVIARGSVDVDMNDQSVAFSGVVIDVTDRKEVERALADSEQRLEFMADAMPQLVWVTRTDGYHEYYNKQWYEYTGTLPGDTDGEAWNDLFHPEDRKRAWSKWQHSLKTGDPYEIEYRLYHAPSQSYRWVIGRALPLADDSGTVLKWYGTCTDIDDQKRTSQIQAFLADASKELSSTLDLNAMLKKVSELCVPTIADWFSMDMYDEDNGFQQLSIAHVDPKKVELIKEYRKRNPVHIDDPTGIPNILRTGNTEFYPHITDEMIEHGARNKEAVGFMKKLKLCSIIIAPIRINETVVGGISFASSDSGRYYTDVDVHMAEELAARISLALTNSKLYTDSIRDLKARKKLEKQLLAEKQKLESRVQRRTKQLERYSESLAQSNRELEDFAYVASHDLQEPLRKIQAFSNLLESEYSEELGDGADYVKRMHAAAVRMSTLIQDLLAFSRVSTKTNPMERIDLNDIVTDVLSDLEARITDVDGTVKVGKLPVVVADPTHIRQLFQNLIGNGLKFHKPGSSPVIEVMADNSDKDMFELTVKDNGIGFDEKYLDRIFSVFQRLHGRDTYEGTGIGLAVCRKIVERYGGTITAKSKKDNGATFIVRLPKIKETEG